MNFKLMVECDECRNSDTIIPKRNIEEFEGKIYEDYTSIADGVSEDNKFIVKQYNEDVTVVTCKNCGKKHDLSL